MCLRAGMNAYLLKPIRPSDLLAALEKAEIVLSKNSVEGKVVS